MRHIRWIVVMIVLLLGLVAAVQNYEAMATPVKFRLDLIFLNYESPEMPLSFLAVISFLVGVILSGIYGIAERFRLKRQIKTLTKDADQKHKELDSLRNLPVTAEDMDLNSDSDSR